LDPPPKILDKRLITKEEFAEFWDRQEPEFDSIKEKLSGYVLHNLSTEMSPRSSHGQLMNNADFVDNSATMDSALPMIDPTAPATASLETVSTRGNSLYNTPRDSFDGFQFKNTHQIDISVESREPVE